MDKSTDIVDRCGFGAEYFSEYRDEFNFIKDHQKRYGNVPDDETMLEAFPNLELISPQESNQYLVDKLNEDYIYRQMAPILNETASMVSTDSIEAARYLLPKVETLLQSKDITNIVNIHSREFRDKQISEYDRKKELLNSTGLLGITSGFPELDIITGGWLPGEELVVVAGRPNQGKSWIGDYMLSKANEAGNIVLLYSGEMSHDLVSGRVVTSITNISNKGITRGCLDDSAEKEYKAYLQSEDSAAPFYVVTPKDLGNRLLTVSMLETLAKKVNADIIGVDQLSLMADERRGITKKDRYDNISNDLFQLSGRLEKPILLNAQANRGTKENKDGAPDLDTIADSDGVGQNSSRVITIAQSPAGFKIAVKKNRYGDNNITLYYHWDIDKGIFTYMPNAQDEEQEEEYDPDAQPENRREELQFQNRRSLHNNSRKLGENEEAF